MANVIKVSCRLVDTCYPDFVPDHQWVGVSLAGQTREEMALEAAEEFYEHHYPELNCEGSEVDYPYGDYAFETIKAAALACIKVGARFWPVDENATEITDPEADVPEEQPSAWFVFDVEVSKMAITISTNDEDDGMVTLYCDDQQAALDDQTVEGSSWEAPADMNVAYACVQDHPGLLEALEKEYDVDSSEYSPPDAEDLARWHAKYLKDGGS